MGRRFKYILLLLGMSVLQLQAVVPAVPSEDSLTVVEVRQMILPKGEDDIQIRKPEERFLEKFRNDPNFNYSSLPRETSLWQRFLWWLRKHLFHPGGGSVSVWFEILLQVLAVCTVTFFIYKLIRSRHRFLFVRKVPEGNVEEMMEQKEMDEKMWLGQLARAVAEGNYVLAIRLHYGYILRLMDARGIVRWNAYRPNRAYYYEIREEGLREKFGELIRIFDCACYGEFRIDETLYKQLDREFIDFRQEVAK